MNPIESLVIIGLLGLFIMIGGVVIHNRYFKTPESCKSGQGLIYDDKDIFGSFGLGGFKCGICNPVGGSYVDEAGYCSQCGTNQYWDGLKCKYCEDGKILDTTNYTCKCAGENVYTNINGTCVKCAVNQEFINNQCRTCMDKQKLVDGKCICIDGTFPNQTTGECTCPSGTVWNYGAQSCIEVTTTKT